MHNRFKAVMPEPFKGPFPRLHAQLPVVLKRSSREETVTFTLTRPRLDGDR